MMSSWLDFAQRDPETAGAVAMIAGGGMIAATAGFALALTSPLAALPVATGGTTIGSNPEARAAVCEAAQSVAKSNVWAMNPFARGNVIERIAWTKPATKLSDN